MENKRRIKQYLIIIGSSVGSLLLGLLTTSLITRLVDTADYGIYSLFLTYANLITIVVCFGLDQSLVRFYYNDQRQEYKNALFRFTCFIPLIATGILGVIAIVLNGIGLFDFITAKTHELFIVMLVIQILFQLLFRFCILPIRLETASKKYAFFNLSQKFVFLIVAILLVQFVHAINSALALMLSSIIAVVCVALGSIYSNRALFFGKADKKSLNRREVIKYGMPFILSMSITSLFEALDKIFLQIFSTNAEIGIYSSAITIVNLFALIQTAFTSLWAPLAVEHYVKAEGERDFYSQIHDVMSVIVFLFGAALIFAKDIFAFLLGSAYRDAAFIMPFLIFHPAMYILSEVTCVGIDFKKKSYLHIIIATIALIANFIGNYLLVPKYSATGAAISTGISYIVFYVCRTFFGIRNYKFNIPYWKLGIVTVELVVYAFINTKMSINYITAIGFVVIVATIAALYFKTIKYIVAFVLDFLKKRNNAEEQADEKN